jgi:CHAP domain
MSIQATIARVDAIRQALADPSELIGARSAASASAETGTATGQGSTAAATAGASPFASALAQASASYGEPVAEGVAYGGQTPLAAAGIAPAYGSSSAGISAGGAGAGQRIVQIAESQIGQSEQPPGSNEGPAVAQYRSATAGAMPGAPWCAYFASWAARQAGEPIGAEGQGLGSVAEIWSWAQSTGRAEPNGPGVVPKPGDLIVFGDEHVGIVRGVLPNGQIETVEGNYENKVAANVRSPTEATGYVSMS